MADLFRAGDTVQSIVHGPKRRYVLACDARGKYAAVCGWPDGDINIDEFEVVDHASDEERLKMLLDASTSIDDRSGDLSRRAIIAREQLGLPPNASTYRAPAIEAAIMPEPVPAELDVLAERARQRKKWSATHDDEHTMHELAHAAAALLLGSAHPWGLANKHHSRRARLVVAAALVLAEIERVDRAAVAKEGSPDVRA